MANGGDAGLAASADSGAVAGVGDGPIFGNQHLGVAAGALADGMSQEDRAQDGKRAPLRVAVLFFGLARRVSDTLPSIQRNIYECNPGVSFHTLASLNLVDRLDNPRSRERSVRVDRGQNLLLPADLFLLTRQDDADIAGPLAMAQRRDDVFGDGWASTRNLLHQLRALQRGWRALTAFSGQGFDLVLFVRPDLLYLDPIRIGEVAAGFTGGRSIAIPSWDSHGGCNDRFALAEMGAARVYAERLDHLAAFLEERPLHAESFLASALAAAGCRPTDLPVRARRVRSNGNIVHEDFSLAGAEPRAQGFLDRAVRKASQHVRLPWLAR